MPDEEKQETASETETDAKAPDVSGHPPNILTRPTDRAARPGFRSKPNQNSHAQRKGKKKR